ncbi:MAG: ATP-binding cassette domain-containing protein [Thermoprotei archaeon]
MSDGCVVELLGVSKSRGGVVVLDGVDLCVGVGGVVCVRARNGSGKTTLARVCALVEGWDGGRVRFLGRELRGVFGADSLRLRYVGYVPQSANLVDTLTVGENIALPLRLMGVGRREAWGAVGEVASRLGVGGLLERFPWQVSGGEAQRVALARALVKKPRLLVADEPTSSQDDVWEREIHSLLLECASGGAGVFVTATQSSHVPTPSRVYTMVGGRLVLGG